MPGSDHSPGGLRGVLFDMDGTLLDSEKIWDVSLQDLAASTGGVLSDAAREAMVGTSMAVSLDIFYADLGLSGRDAETDAAWLDDRTMQLFGAGLTWRPGAEALLGAARAAGLATALVTATNRPLVEAALQQMGSDRFDVVVCGGETAAKPSPEPYTAALDRLRLEPTDVLVIEDSPTGVAAARAAGCVVLAVPLAAPLAEQPGVVQRADLTGLTVADLAAVRTTALAHR